MNKDFNGLGLVLMMREAHSAGTMSRDEIAHDIKELIQIVNTTSMIVANQIITANTPDEQRAIAKYIDTRIEYDERARITPTKMNTFFSRDRDRQ